MRLIFIFCFQLFAFSVFADDVFFLRTGEESLLARLQLIKEAQKQISFMTYEFNACDTSTKLLLDELINKAKQGVQVRFILDSYDNTGEERTNLAAYLKKYNIPLLIYSDPWFFPPAKNHRNHIKLLVVDDNGYIVGGRNSKDEYFGLSKDMNYIDQDVLVYGPSAQKALSDFNQILRNGFITRALPGKSSTAFEASCLAKNVRDWQVLLSLQNNTFLQTAQRHSCPMVSFAADNPRFLSLVHLDSKNHQSDLSDRALKFKGSTQLFLEFLAGTERNLLVENQYYLPIYRMEKIFNTLRKKLTLQNIDVFTNKTGYGFGWLDKPLTALLMLRAQQGSTKKQYVYPLSSLGALAGNHSLTPPTARWRIHTKSAVRDREDVLISSFNIDPRSYHTNLEAAVVMHNCPTLAQAVETQIGGLYMTYYIDRIFCGACERETEGITNKDIVKALVGENFL